MSLASKILSREKSKIKEGLEGANKDLEIQDLKSDLEDCNRHIRTLGDLIRDDASKEEIMKKYKKVRDYFRDIESSIKNLL